MFIRRKPRVREVNGERTMINNREQAIQELKDEFEANDYEMNFINNIILKKVFGEELTK